MEIMKALEHVFLEGRIIEKGSIFSCSPEFSKKLVEGKTAKPVKVKEQVEKSETITKESLESMTKEKLLDFANNHGIEGVSDIDKKADIIEAILKAAD